MGDYKLSIVVSIFLIIIGGVFILLNNLIAGITNIALGILWLIITLIVAIQNTNRNSDNDK